MTIPQPNAVFSWAFLESTLFNHASSQLKSSGLASGDGILTITTDSRKVTTGTLFVAIQGEKFDGHSFLASAIQQGATAILCRHGTLLSSEERSKCRVFEVTDPESAYRALGAAWRQKFGSIPTLVIAGSVGKTTTKELLAAILQGKYQDQVLKTQGSQNGFLGIPMTLLEVRPETHAVAVIEVGIDEPHTMTQHMQLVRGTHALLTAIGPEHLEKLIDLPTVAREEAIALEDTVRFGGRALVNLDDPWIAPLAKTLRQDCITTYSLGGKADIMGRRVTDSILEIHAPQRPAFQLTSPLPGEHHARNLLAATAMALAIGLEPDDLRRGLDTFKGAAGRTEIQKLPGEIRVIADHYNANPTSMNAAFEILHATPVASGAKKIACLGDMLELGAGEEQWHRGLAAGLLRLQLDAILLYGPRMKWLESELKKEGYAGQLRHFESHAALAQSAKTALTPGSVLLLKGSRGMRMETVLKIWSELKNAEVLPADTLAIQKAAALLQAGDVVGMPTETVYGLAGNAFDEQALTRIFSTKERPTFDPLIVHITRSLLDQNAPDSSILDGLENLGLVKKDALSDLARSAVETLTAEFWPGPLTLVLPRGERVPDLVSSGLPTVALRMPAHPVAQALINQAGVPLAAPSANRFGRISPTTAQAVAIELGDRIPLILDGGACDIGVESTVISITDSGEPVLLRPGGISSQQLAEHLGTEVLKPSQPTSQTAAQPAPGMLASHYAPRKSLRFLPKSFHELDWAHLKQELGSAKLGILLQSGAIPTQPSLADGVLFETLTENGDRAEAARNLFQKLRVLDASEAELLFVEPVPTREGLDHAIADRLERATAPRSD